LTIGGVHVARLTGEKYLAKISDEGAQACCFASFGLGTC